MKAELLIREKLLLSASSFAEVVVWRVPRSVPASAHAYKYRLAFVVDGTCRVRYDNEAGKGDHKHKGDSETPYVFVSIETLLADFWHEVDAWR